MALQPVTMYPAIFDAPNAANAGLFLQNQSGNTTGQNQVANWAPMVGSNVAASIVQTKAAAPTGTTSATAVMGGMGDLGTPAIITPISDRVIFEIGGIAKNGTISDGGTFDLRYGTGAAPANGAAVVGTAIGQAVTITEAVAAGQSGIVLKAFVAGLTPGTAYWFDFSQLAVTGGTASLANVYAIAFEY